MKVKLVLDAGLIIFAHAVTHEGDGCNRRNHSLPIKVNDLQQFLFLVPRKLVFEITHHVLQNVGSFIGRRFQGKGFQEKTLIFFLQIFPGDFFCFRHELSHHLMMFRTVGRTG